MIFSQNINPFITGTTGQKDSATYRNHYAANNAGVDGQATFFNDQEHRTDIADLFRSLLITRNPELWQSLSAEKRHALEQSDEFKDIEAKLEDPSSDDALSKNKRKELQAQKRKLISEALRECQREQPIRPASRVDAYTKECTGHHRTIFQRARKLMLVRDRLASSMFIEATVRSDVGKAVLLDLIELYSQEEEVAFRLGLELDKCHCLRTGFARKIDRYHLMTHTLFLAIVCLTIYFYYLSPTEWQY